MKSSVIHGISLAESIGSLRSSLDPPSVAGIPTLVDEARVAQDETSIKADLAG